MNQPEEELPHGGLSAGEDAAQTREAPGRSGLSLLLRRGPTDAVVQQGQEEVGSEAEENAMADDEVEKTARLSAVQLRKTSWEVTLQCAALPAATASAGEYTRLWRSRCCQRGASGPRDHRPVGCDPSGVELEGGNRRSMQIADP